MVDLHSHFLPNIDDGAKEVKESLEMLEDSYNQGVRLCVATPHCIVHRESDIDEFCQRVQNSLQQLNNSMSEQVNYPEILVGAEVYLDNDISKYENIEKLCIEGTKYILVEFPVYNQDRHLADWVYSLTVKGLTPVIAHIDRYTNSKQLIEDMNDIKVIYQINASEFLTFSGIRNLKKLFKTGERFVVSSDMHNMTSRTCHMKQAYDVARKKFKYFDVFAKDLNLN